jgi:hypothetical protein
MLTASIRIQDVAGSELTAITRDVNRMVGPIYPFAVGRRQFDDRYCGVQAPHRLPVGPQRTARNDRASSCYSIHPH